MGTLKQQLQKAKGLSPNAITASLFQFLKSIEPQMADLNRDQLFEASIDIFGQSLGFYSKATERITTEEKLAGLRDDIKEWGTPYTMRDKGVFLPTIYASVSNGFITFGATDPKLDEILDNPRLLTKEFFGLTDKNKTLVIQNYLTPFILNNFRAKLGI